MSFFELQKAARRRMHLLMVLFGLSVAATIFAIYYALIVTGHVLGMTSSAPGDESAEQRSGDDDDRSATTRGNLDWEEADAVAEVMARHREMRGFSREELDEEFEFHGSLELLTDRELTLLRSRWLASATAEARGDEGAVERWREREAAILRQRQASQHELELGFAPGDLRHAELADFPRLVEQWQRHRAAVEDGSADEAALDRWREQVRTELSDRAAQAEREEQAEQADDTAAVAATQSDPRGSAPAGSLSLFLWVALIAGGIILFGTLYKVIELGRGAGPLFQKLGGKRISAKTEDFGERRLLNVVEEMAVASGMTVPTVYVLPNERSINAFAAGFSPDTAAIAVTAGALNNLSREELQGVIAHEFAHILSGDMRTNILMIGVLHGVLMIGLYGYAFLHAPPKPRKRPAPREDRLLEDDGENPAVIFMAYGFLLVVVGYIGVLFGNLIKAALSRQREFHADATAVRLTRDRDGIAGALRKIGGSRRGSRILSPHSQIASHMYFGNATRKRPILSTHPPVAQRLQRIDPNFDGKIPEVQLRSTPEWATESSTPQTQQQQASPQSSAAWRQRLQEQGMHAVFCLSREKVVEEVGAPQYEHLVFAHDLIENLSPRLHAVLHDPDEVAAVCYAMLLADKPETRAQQLARIKESSETHASITEEITPELAEFGPAARLPLIDIAMGAMREMSPEAHREFRSVLADLIRALSPTPLFAYVIMQVLNRHLTPVFEQTKRPRTRHRTVIAVARACAELFAVISEASHDNQTDTEGAFKSAMTHLNLTGMTFPTSDESWHRRLHASIQQLARATPHVKRRVLAALMACIEHDGIITVDEMELLRAVADTLDCPMPPLLATHSQDQTKPA